MRNAVILLIAAIVYCYYSPFVKNIKPMGYSVALPEKFDGPLEVNDKLEKVEKLHENKIHWPESMAVYKGKIYTGLGDGRIVRISEDEVVDICSIGEKCEGQHQEHICGRPLGMQFDKKGLLYVVDAYHGLFLVNVETGQKTQLLPSSTVVGGRPLTFLNDLVILEKENAIILTQSSTRWNISNVIISILEHDTSGRLLRYDLKTKQLKVLLHGISFPNGVELSHDGNILLVAEGNAHSVIRYHIGGKNKSEIDELPMILPGEPDNISRNPRGNYWVGISSARTAESPTIYDRVSEYPSLRKWFLYIHHIISLPISGFFKFLPNKRSKELGYEILNGRLVADAPMKHGIIVEFNDKGEIVQSLHSPSGNIRHISEVLEKDGYLYLGSWRNHFLGRLKL